MIVPLVLFSLYLIGIPIAGRVIYRKAMEERKQNRNSLEEVSMICLVYTLFWPILLVIGILAVISDSYVLKILKEEKDD